jgi:hypothetical protein
MEETLSTSTAWPLLMENTLDVKHDMGKAPGKKIAL